MTEQNCAICEDSGKFIAMLAEVSTSVRYMEAGQEAMKDLLTKFIDTSEGRFKHIAREVVIEELQKWDAKRKEEDLKLKKFTWSQFTWAVTTIIALALAIASFYK